MREKSENNDLKVTLEDLWKRARMDIEAVLLEVKVMRKYDILGGWDKNE